MAFIAAQLSADVRALADCLLATPVGEIVTLDQLSSALGSDINLRRYLVASAIRVASREAGAVFSSIRAVGYKRLSAAQSHMIASTTRRRFRSAGRSSSRVMQNAVAMANGLTDEEKRVVFRELSVLALIVHVASDKAAAAAPVNDKPTPVAETMRAMMTRIGAP